MGDQQFTVTLPSNSNMKEYPTNRGNKYVVKLNSKLYLGGQTLNDDVSWETALTALQYANRFYDVREPTEVHMVVIVPNTSTMDMSQRSPPGVIQFTPMVREENIISRPPIEARILTRFVKAEDASDRTSFPVYTKVTVPAGYYKTPAHVYGYIVEEFNRLLGARYNVQLGVATHGTEDMIQFRLEPESHKLFMYTEKPSMVNMLGLRAKEIDDQKPPIYAMGLMGARAPRLDAVQSLYVYCDIVKPQHVGDVLAPLLDIVPVHGAFGERVHYNANPLNYLPVNRNAIETIGIHICDEYGNPVIFPDDVDTVVCRMRFRRVKSNGYML